MNKILYVDIAKKGLTNIVKPRKIITSKEIPLIQMLVRKLFKYDKQNPKFNTYTKQIYKIIEKTNLEKNNIIRSMLEINDIINNSNIIKPSSQPNHKWVASNIVNIIKKYGFDKNVKIIDIGGGEGNILKIINEMYNVSNDNLYCVEQIGDWSEKYKFMNNINYIFWDNININIEPNTVDVIIIMVSMHHMDDATLNNLLHNTKKILKNNGIVIIKEHDHNSKISRIIDWEHHLYHLLMSEDQMITLDNLDNYLETFVNNYKSKKEFDVLFRKYGYVGAEELNRYFQPLTNAISFNPTNLYWKIYKNNNKTT